MVLVGREKLQQFTEEHADARGWINAWVAEIKIADWKSPSDIKRQYSTASILADAIVIFNVKGNNYRLKTQIDFSASVIAIKWIGTHAEYTKRHK